MNSRAFHGSRVLHESEVVGQTLDWERAAPIRVSTFRRSRPAWITAKTTRGGSHMLAKGDRAAVVGNSSCNRLYFLSYRLGAQMLSYPLYIAGCPTSPGVCTTMFCSE